MRSTAGPNADFRGSGLPNSVRIAGGGDVLRGGGSLRVVGMTVLGLCGRAKVVFSAIFNPLRKEGCNGGARCTMCGDGEDSWRRMRCCRSRGTIGRVGGGRVSCRGLVAVIWEAPLVVIEGVCA